MVNISRSQVPRNKQHCNITPPQNLDKGFGFLTSDGTNIWIWLFATCFLQPDQNLYLSSDRISMSLVTQLTSVSSVHNVMTFCQMCNKCHWLSNDCWSCKLWMFTQHVRRHFFPKLLFWISKSKMFHSKSSNIQMHFSILLTYKIWGSCRALIYLEVVQDYLQKKFLFGKHVFGWLWSSASL